MPIAEIFISAFVTVLFEKVASSDLLTFSGNKEIKKWSNMLGIIKSKLSDAEDQQIKNKEAHHWLEELQDLAYDLDDVLDEFATEQIKLKLKLKLKQKQKQKGLIPFQPNTIKTKVKALLPGGLVFRFKMMSKINGISTKLDFLTRQINNLNLASYSNTSANKPTSQRTPTTSLIHEPKICGRDEDRNEIIKLLQEDDVETSQGNDNIGVISIVGMGGIGKTTLAQAVYNDDIVKKHFPLRVWVCVSDEFNLLRVTKAILESVTLRSCDFNELDKIQDELKTSFVGRKFLIVLDDVWHKDDHDLSVLKCPFRDATRGSKVVVTTRDENVASIIGSSKHQHYFLQLLPLVDCWSVFAQHAFEHRNMNECTNLVEIGKKIVKDRCKGLPLSARMLGGLLRCKESEAEWKDVLDSVVWGEDTKILPSLRLSYHHLPSYLKPCFAYCSILPKDYEFSKDELVLLWMAEGFIQQGRENKQLEEIGHDYFHELLSRSLFQLSSTEDNSNSFVMHDLVNDLAQEISGHLCFRLEEKLEDLEKSRNLGRARHSSFLQGKYDGMKKFKSFVEGERLRTFLPFALKVDDCFLASDVPFIVFRKMRRLRSLSLKFYNVVELPDSVGDMKHLRYLDLSYTKIETLPDWVQKLYNLQTLILRGCKNLKRLPKNMGNLINLRYFDVTNAVSLEEMPQGIGNMENLRLLSNFILTKHNGSRIRELGKLRHIGETLCISGLHNVTDPMDAKGACIIEKERLNKIMMFYDANSDEIPNERVAKEVLHMLQPHITLTELCIGGYHGTRFPTWLGDPMFTNMVSIEIMYCRNCSVLPELGQLQSLKKLCIQGMSSVKHVDREFYGKIYPKPFPHLETLKFKNMPEWEDWFGFGVEDKVQPFANVKKLLIEDCPKFLGKLPTNLPSLQVLEIIKCQKLVVELDGLNYPSITSFVLDGVELPFTPSKCWMLLSLTANESSLRSLSSLSIKNVLMPDSLCNMSISFQNLNSVEIEGVPEIVYLPKWLTRDLTTLKQLDVKHCKKLKTLLDNTNSNVTQLHHQFPVLQRLCISCCPELVSLLFEETEEESRRQRESGAVVQSFMERLESLKIEYCYKLEKLPRGLYLLTRLVDIHIAHCDNLVSLPDAGFPPSLRSVSIKFCDALESPLPCWNSGHNLENLEVIYCSSLTGLVSASSNSSSMNIGGLPSSLKRLHIMYCEKLEALFTGGEDMKIHCPSLEIIDITYCGRLKYLPDTLCDDSLGKLNELFLIGCGDLPYLPDGWFCAIPSVRHISIGGWRKGAEKRVFSYILKEAGFLTNLTSLWLNQITTDVHPSEWGLHRLSSLRELGIEGPIRIARENEEEDGKVVKVSVFPLDGMLLPTSLTNLDIYLFPDLERLSSIGFECLTFLETLLLWRCPRLAYFPEGGLPDTLLKLEIMDCPLLMKQSEKGKSKNMHILSRIPYAHY